MAAAIAQGFSEERSLVSNTPTSTVGSINTTAAGSTFVCAIRGYSPPVTAVTDSKSNTYSLLASVTIGGTALSVWICYNGTGGSTHRPTITQTSGDLVTVSFFEVTGAKTASVIDGSVGSGLDSSSPFNATVTTTNANDLIITIGSSDGGAGTVTYTPGSGFSLATGGVTWTSGTNGISLGVMSQSVSATGTYGGNFTQSSGSNAGVVTFALQDLASASSIAAIANYHRRARMS